MVTDAIFAAPIADGANGKCDEDGGHSQEEHHHQEDGVLGIVRYSDVFRLLGRRSCNYGYPKRSLSLLSGDSTTAAFYLFCMVSRRSYSQVC